MNRQSRTAKKPHTKPKKPNAPHTSARSPRYAASPSDVSWTVAPVILLLPVGRAPAVPRIRTRRRAALSLGSSAMEKPSLLGAYAKPTCVSGSANANEPPAPSAPNARPLLPNWDSRDGLMKPIEKRRSACHTKSLSLSTGTSAGAVSSSTVPAGKPSRWPPVARSPKALAIPRALP